LIVAAAVVGGMFARYGRGVVDVSTYKMGRTVHKRGEVRLIENPKTVADKIVNGAKMEAIAGVRYHASYVRISYPNGDVPKDEGACTDVVVRALRNAGYDLQKLMHEDMEAHFDLYPKRWGLSRPDPNIDHRRTPNQMVFFSRFGTELPMSTEGDALKTWQPGDIIYWDLCSGHTGVVSNVKNSDGVPLVIHNLGVTSEEDCLNAWPIIGHFRYPKG
jgi:uncharacterized protein YijF (DUF1287 family)